MHVSNPNSSQPNLGDYFVDMLGSSSFLWCVFCANASLSGSGDDRQGFSRAAATHPMLLELASSWVGCHAQSEEF